MAVAQPPLSGSGEFVVALGERGGQVLQSGEAAVVAETWRQACLLPLRCTRAAVSAVSLHTRLIVGQTHIAHQPCRSTLLLLRN
jgi:hypothetical protein